MTDTGHSIEMHQRIMALWRRVDADREPFERIAEGLADVKPRDTGFTIIVSNGGVVYITHDDWTRMPEWKMLPFDIAADLKAAMDKNDDDAYQAVLVRIREWWVLNG